MLACLLPQCVINDLCWKLIEKLISLGNAPIDNECMFWGYADDRDWPMDRRWRQKGCLELGTIVTLTDAGEKKLYCVSV